MRRIVTFTVAVFAAAALAADNLPAQARATIEKAVAYFTAKVATHGGCLWEFTRSDSDCPTHYSFKGNYGVESAIAFYERVKRDGRDKILAERERKPAAQERPARAKRLEPAVQKIIAALDAEGRWISGDRIECAVFCHNVETLAEFLELLR